MSEKKEKKEKSEKSKSTTSSGKSKSKSSRQASTSVDKAGAKSPKDGADKFSPKPRTKDKQDPESNRSLRTSASEKDEKAATLLALAEAANAEESAVEASISLFVKSNYGNLSGVYREIPASGCMGRLSYKNKAGTCLYYLDAGGSWAFAPQLQSKSVFLQAKSECTSPVEVPSDAWGEKIEAIKQIKDIQEGHQAFPGRLLVKSSYGNLRGAYDRIADGECAGRPSYKNKGGVCLYFFEEKCFWVFGPELGGAAFFTGCESDAITPLDLSLEAFPEGGITEIRELEDVKGDQSQSAPERIHIKSSFSNLRGVYALVAGKESSGRPSYEKENKRDVFLYFLEDVNSWLMGPEFGGSGAFTRADTSCISPLEIPNDAWENEAVSEIRLLPVVDKDAYKFAPQRLFVRTTYSNLRGVYKRVRKKDCAGRPSYQNSKDVYLYYLEDACSWIFGPTLGADQAFARFESGATTPLQVNLEKEESVTEIRQMPEVDKEVLATAPARIAVRSPYGNVTGVYKRVLGKDSGERPSYGNDHGSFLWFCEDICSWVFGESLGSTRFYCKAESDAPIPLEVTISAWGGDVDEVWDLGEIKEDALQNLPEKLGLDSKYGNINGGYVRADDCEGFPTYHNKPKGKYLWHKLAERQWVLTDAKPGEKGHYAKGKYMKWDSMVLDPLQLVGQECEFYEVNWHEHERKGFIDPNFLPEAPSLGVERDHEVQWIRASDLDRELSAVLWHTIKPNNLLQGAVGNCWLLAAISCLAAVHPKMIEELFVTADKVHMDGRYSIRLYSVLASDWQNVEIDDLIPCRKREWFEKQAKPIAAHPYKNEIWVLLLEKAFAKFVGSFGALEGGEVAWALQAITGCEDCWSFKRKDGGDWFRYDNDLCEQRKQVEKGDRRAMAFLGGLESITSAELFKHISGNFKKHYLMSCSVSSEGKPRRSLRASWLPKRLSKRNSKSASAPRKSMAQRAGDAVRGILGKSDNEGSMRQSFMDKSSNKKSASRRSSAGKRKSLFQGLADLADWAAGGENGKLEETEPDKDEVERAQKVRPDGLIDDHAYSVTNIVEVDTLRLVQLQNPWGDGQEWNGAWSDHSSEWEKHPELRRRLRPERRDSVRGMADGSFWMSFDDFSCTFDHIGVCPLKAGSHGFMRLRTCKTAQLEALGPD